MEQEYYYISINVEIYVNEDPYDIKGEPRYNYYFTRKVSYEPEWPEWEFRISAQECIDEDPEVSADPDISEATLANGSHVEYFDHQGMFDEPVDALYRDYGSEYSPEQFSFFLFFKTTADVDIYLRKNGSLISQGAASVRPGDKSRYTVHDLVTRFAGLSYPENSLFVTGEFLRPSKTIYRLTDVVEITSRDETYELDLSFMNRQTNMANVAVSTYLNGELQTSKSGAAPFDTGEVTATKSVREWMEFVGFDMSDFDELTFLQARFLNTEENYFRTSLNSTISVGYSPTHISVFFTESTYEERPYDIHWTVFMNRSPMASRTVEVTELKGRTVMEWLLIANFPYINEVRASSPRIDVTWGHEVYREKHTDKIFTNDRPIDISVYLDGDYIMVEGTANNTVEYRIVETLHDLPLIDSNQFGTSALASRYLEEMDFTVPATWHLYEVFAGDEDRLQKVDPDKKILLFYGLNIIWTYTTGRGMYRVIDNGTQEADTVYGSVQVRLTLFEENRYYRLYLIDITDPDNPFVVYDIWWTLNDLKNFATEVPNQYSIGLGRLQGTRQIFLNHRYAMNIGYNDTGPGGVTWLGRREFEPMSRSFGKFIVEALDAFTIQFVIEESPDPEPRSYKFIIRDEKGNETEYIRDANDTPFTFDVDPGHDYSSSEMIQPMNPNETYSSEGGSGTGISEGSGSGAIVPPQGGEVSVGHGDQDPAVTPDSPKIPITVVTYAPDGSDDYIEYDRVEDAMVTPGIKPITAWVVESGAARPPGIIIRSDLYNNATRDTSNYNSDVAITIKDESVLKVYFGEGALIRAIMYDNNEIVEEEWFELKPPEFSGNTMRSIFFDKLHWTLPSGKSFQKYVITWPTNPEPYTYRDWTQPFTFDNHQYTIYYFMAGVFDITVNFYVNEELKQTLTKSFTPATASYHSVYYYNFDPYITVSPKGYPHYMRINNMEDKILFKTWSVQTEWSENVTMHVYFTTNAIVNSYIRLNDTSFGATTKALALYRAQTPREWKDILEIPTPRDGDYPVTLKSVTWETPDEILEFNPNYPAYSENQVMLIPTEHNVTWNYIGVYPITVQTCLLGSTEPYDSVTHAFGKQTLTIKNWAKSFIENYGLEKPPGVIDKVIKAAVYDGTNWSEYMPNDSLLLNTSYTVIVFYSTDRICTVRAFLDGGEEPYDETIVAFSATTITYSAQVWLNLAISNGLNIPSGKALRRFRNKNDGEWHGADEISSVLYNPGEDDVVLEFYYASSYQMKLVVRQLDDNLPGVSTVIDEKTGSYLYQKQTVMAWIESFRKNHALTLPNARLKYAVLDGDVENPIHFGDEVVLDSNHELVAYYGRSLIGKAFVYLSRTWRQAVTYIHSNLSWKTVIPYIHTNNRWRS